MLANTRPSSVFRLCVFLFELLAIDVLGGCWSLAPNANEFVQRDSLPSVQVTHQPLFNATSSFTSWGSAWTSFSNGPLLTKLRVVGWIDSSDNTPHAAIYDATTGALIRSDQLESGQACVNINIGIVNSTTAVVIAAEQGSATIIGFTMDLTSLSTWVGPTVVSIGTYTNTSGVYGCDFTASSVYLAWESAGSPTSAVAMQQYSSSLSLVASANVNLTNYHGFTAIAAKATDGERIWVSVVSANTPVSSHLVLATSTLALPGTTNFQAVTPNSLMSGATSANVTRMAIERVTSTQCVAMFDAQQAVTSYAQFSTTTQVGVAMGVVGRGIASAPAYVGANGTAYAMMFAPYVTHGVQGVNPGSYFFVDLLLGTTNVAVIPRIQSVLAPNIVNIAVDPSGQTNVPRIALNQGAREMVAPIVRGAAGRQGLELFTIETTDFAKAWGGGVTLGKELYVGGEYYDGNRAVEVGFPRNPLLPTATNNAGSGSTYSYCYTYARVDAQGNLEESAPSPIVTQTSGATPNITITVQALGLTNKQRLNDPITTAASSVVYAIIYRTQAAASGDTTFYRLTVEPFPAALLNTQAASSMSFIDTLADATLSTQPVLYTMSGELPHDAPESFVAATVHKDRVWGIGADLATIWISQTYVAGTLPAFSDAVQLTVDDAGEPLTCLASLYDKLLIFTRTKIYVVFGDGPAPNGGGSDLTAPQRVPSISGCIDPRSVVNTPLGVMFQSERGIELVGPDLSVQFIGQPVMLSSSLQGSPSTIGFGLGPTPIGMQYCVGACFDGASSTVRFAFANSQDYPQDGQGVVLTYDVRRSRWAVWQYTNGGTLTSGVMPQHTAIVKHPTYGVVMAHNDTASGGFVYRENNLQDATPWLDFGTYFVPMQVKTAWVKSGDEMGWQTIRRVRVLLQKYAAHQLFVYLNADYDSRFFPFGEAHIWADTTIDGFVVNGLEQVKAVPGAATRYCEAISVTVRTIAPATDPQGSGRGAGLTGIALEVLPKKGGWRRNPSSAVT